MIYYNCMKKGILFAFLSFFALNFFLSEGIPFALAQNNQFFDYPEELLNKNANQPLTPIETTPPVAAQESGDTYQVQEQESISDLFQQADLLNSSNGLPSGVTEQVSVTFSPENPQAGDTLTIFVESFSTDLNRAMVLWRANEVEQPSGRGATQQSFLVPESGERLVIDLAIQTVEGNTIYQSYTIAPAKVDLYYEADTYTPPFYKGKRIYTHQSDVTVFAFPYINEGGRFLNKNELSYIWEVDNRVVQDKSGYGKSSFTHNSGLLSQQAKISVTVSSVGNPSVAEADIFITPKEPNVLLYENHPLYGLIIKNIVDSAYALTTADVFITAIPLFFSTNSREDTILGYSWSLNGESLGVFDNQSEIAFRNSNNEEGQARIRTQIKNTRNILQSITVAGDLVFSKLSDFIETAGDEFFF